MSRPRMKVKDVARLSGREPRELLERLAAQGLVLPSEDTRIPRARTSWARQIAVGSEKVQDVYINAPPSPPSARLKNFGPARAREEPVMRGVTHDDAPLWPTIGRRQAILFLSEDDVL